MIVFEVNRNAEGSMLCCASVEGDGCGFRISGPKAWGGAKRIAEIKINESDMAEFILGYCPEVADKIIGNDAAKTRIAELEKALEPFAKEGAFWIHEEKHVPDNVQPICDAEVEYDRNPYRAEFEIGDLRRAAALLKEDNQ